MSILDEWQLPRLVGSCVKNQRLRRSEIRVFEHRRQPCEFREISPLQPLDF